MVGREILEMPERQANGQYCWAYFGLVRCRVLAPRELLMPVLPLRLKDKGKCYFSLCKRCCELKQTSKCKHSDDERAFIFTGFTEELLLALDEGYKLLWVSEVYHWAERAQFDGKTDESGLFSEMTNLLLKSKIENSGKTVRVYACAQVSCVQAFQRTR